MTGLVLRAWGRSPLLRALAALMVALATGAAHPHAASDAWLDLRAAPAGAAVRLDVALRDLDAAIGLDADADGAITAGELDARGDAIAAAVLAGVSFAAEGGRCTASAPAREVARRSDGNYAVLRFALDCGGAATAIDVDYRLFADIDASHRAILTVAGQPPVPLRPGAGPQRAVLVDVDRVHDGRLATLAGFFVEGLRHILDGIDHLAFVLALALAAVAVAARDGTTFRATATSLAALVTLFTVAHSVTLAGVALGWFALPSRWVESVIAASVVLAGLQVLRVARVGAAAAAPAGLVFAFGLVHGFGFGSALAESGLDGQPVVAALAGFNLGVEAGQIAVLAVLFPLLWLARRRRAYTRAVQPALASVIVAAGALWFAERALGLDGFAAWAAGG